MAQSTCFVSGEIGNEAPQKERPCSSSLNPRRDMFYRMLAYGRNTSETVRACTEVGRKLTKMKERDIKRQLASYAWKRFAPAGKNRIIEWRHVVRRKVKQRSRDKKPYAPDGHGNSIVYTVIVVNSAWACVVCSNAFYECCA